MPALTIHRCFTRLLKGKDWIALPELGTVKVEFDARASNNHGIKFQITARALSNSYETDTLLFTHN